MIASIRLYHAPADSLMSVRIGWHVWTRGRALALHSRAYATWMKGIYRGIASSLFRDGCAPSSSVVYKGQPSQSSHATHPIFLSISLFHTCAWLVYFWGYPHNFFLSLHYNVKRIPCQAHWHLPLLHLCNVHYASWTAWRRTEYQWRHPCSCL